MRHFDNGVRYFTQATAPIHFPEDDICCYRCPLMGKTLGIDREVCNRTGEILPSPRQTIGYNCPLKFEERNVDKTTGEIIEEVNNE